MKQTTRLEEQRFSDWQRGLAVSNLQKAEQSIIESVSERQAALRKAVKGGAEVLAAYLREQLDVSSNVKLEAPLPPRPLAPTEYRDPPFELEREIYEAWSGQVPRSRASQPVFWTLCHIDWLEQGLLAEPLDQMLLGTLATGAKENSDDAAARNLLRRMGGLPHIRGAVSVLSDSPMSRAWWRGRIGEQAAEAANGELDAITAHRVLHASNDAWDRLTGDSVRRITVINQSSVRAALICEYREAARYNGALPAREAQRTMRLLAGRGASRAFDALPWTELRAMTADTAALARRQLAAEAKMREDAKSEPNGTQTVKRRRRGWRQRFLG